MSTSTAAVYSTTMMLESRSHRWNGGSLRSSEPTAPCRVVTQKPLIAEMTTANRMIVGHDTPSRRRRRLTGASAARAWWIEMGS